MIQPSSIADAGLARTRALAAPLGQLCLALALSGLAGCGVAEERVQPRDTPIIHGDDDRHEVYEDTGATDPIQATAALMLDTSITVDGSSVTLEETRTLGEVWQLCQGERFSDQPTNAFCSATLIRPNMVLTANHCVPTQAACDDTRIVFDYHYVAEGVLASIDADDVYTCADRVAADGASDYVVLQLDRAVVGRNPVSVRYYDVRTCNGGVGESEALTAYGYPNGVPMKIDDGATLTVASRSSGRFFRATFDSFAIQNGGGVFAERADGLGVELVGMLEGGGAGYEQAGDCYVPVVVDAADAESSVQTAMHAVQAMRGYCAADLPDMGYPRDCPTEVPACDADGVLDAGVAPFPPSVSGCGCRVTGRSAPGAPVGLALLVLMAAAWRWRRARP